MKVQKTFLFIVTFFIFRMEGVLAFDTKMHVWVGQEVLSDLLPDGSVSIPPYGEVRVDEGVYSAIKNNQSTYLSGNLGPDVFPDVMGGQVTTHPGVEGGMQTDDWLEWVLSGASSQNEQAFAYGYLAHAAADVFAHTYVNWYAGDVFDLTDGEISVEVRHTMLEKYLAKYIPDYKYGLPHSSIATPSQLPISFIRDRLLRNDIVQNEYGKAGAVHLASMFQMEKDLEDLEKELSFLVTPGEELYGKLLYQQVKLANELALAPLKIAVTVEEKVCTHNKVFFLLGFWNLVTSCVVTETVNWVSNPVR